MEFSNTIKWIIKQILSISVHVNRNKIVFTNFKGNGYGDNPKYITEELIKRNHNYDLVWLVRDMNLKLPMEIRKVNINSFRALLEYASAKVWVSNVRSSKGITKKKSQYYIQTWHATLHFKKVEADAVELSEKFKKQSIADGKMTDLMFANNKFMYEQYKNVFWYSGRIIRCGVPRVSIILNTPKCIYEKVRTYFGIEPETLMILYAPTFRDNGNIDIYIWNYRKICELIKQKTGKEVCFLLRLHPNIDQSSDAFKFDNKIINASYYEDMQELLAVADYLITDFSSVAFDFSIAYKPVVLFAPDFAEYSENERGLVINYKELPYDLVTTEEGLHKWFATFDIISYKKKINAFLDQIEFEDDGNGAKVIADIIDDVMKR